jgi:hypothetical protein
VAILKIFGDNTHNSRNANLGKLTNSQYMNSYDINSYLSNSHIRIRSNERLIVKEKTIRVLLDTGSSGDLLFVKKGSQKYIPTMKRAVPQSWGTSNGTFKTNKVGEITLSFVEIFTKQVSSSDPRHSRIHLRSHGTFV